MGKLPKETIEKMDKHHISEKAPISLSDLEASVNRAGLEKVFDELVSYSIRYVLDVYNMDKMRQAGYSLDEEGSREVMAQADKQRTLLHTALLDQVNILIRNLRKAEEDISWANSMFDMRTGEVSRARAGKFGLGLVASIVKKEDTVYSEEKGVA